MVDLPGGRVRGRIPTGHYPTAVSVSADGSRLFVVNAKSNAGANPANSLTTEAGRASNTTFQNQYGWALMKAGISTIPVPDEQTLTALSQQVDRNNGFNNRNSDPLMRYLQRRDSPRHLHSQGKPYLRPSPG